MANTVTSYTTFTPGTKAKSAEVNANFDNHRATLVPINDNTASASDLTHDLGTTDHRWRVGYLDELRLAGDTTAGNYIASTSGGGIVLSARDPIDFLIDGSTVGSWASGGMKRVTVNSHYAESSAVSVTVTSGSITALPTPISVSVSCSGGRIMIMTQFDNPTMAAIDPIQMVYTNLEITNMQIGLARDTTTNCILSLTWRWDIPNTGTGNRINMNPYLMHIDNPGAGTHTYHLLMSKGTLISNVEVNKLKLVAFEI